MGNMVIVSVKHNEVGKLTTESLKLSMDMLNDNEMDCPKFYDGSHLSKARPKHPLAYNGSTLVSHAYDSSGVSHLFVNNKVMASLPGSKDLSDLFGELKSAKAIPDAVRKVLTKGIADDINLGKKGKKAVVEAFESNKEEHTGGNYSLFGILTDELDEIDYEKTVEAIKYEISNIEERQVGYLDEDQLFWMRENGFLTCSPNCPIDHIDEDGELTPLKITALGSYRANQTAVVNLHANTFTVFSLPNYGVYIEGIKEKIKAENDEMEKIINIDCYAEVLRGLGFQIKK